jgi:hypothetical protein
MKKLVAAAVVAIATTGSVSASDYANKPGYKAVTVWVTQYVDVVKSVPYEKTITKYDHCGKPYHVTVTAYRDVTVQVAKKVAVTKWVKVCD